MNDKDLEQRLRSVVKGEQPSAPASLRHFLRELPQTEARRRSGLSGALDRLRDGIPGKASVLVPRSGMGRQLQLAGGLALAVVLGVAMTGILLSLRGHPPVANTPSQQPTQVVTPRRTSPQAKVVTFDIANNPYWYGIPRLGNEDEALPVVAAAVGSMMFVGVSADPYGLNGIVRSSDGLLWDWDPISIVDPNLAELTSIAADTTGTLVVVGWAPDGKTKDGRAYVSPDGVNWKPVADQSVFAGTPLRTIVHGPAGFVALGWADPSVSAASPTGAQQPVLEWVSGDGLSWQRVPGLPVQGSALVFATAGGYILSGTPFKTGAYDQPPIWSSIDGRDWTTQSTTTDNSAAKLGPLASLTQQPSGNLIGLAWLKSGGEQLVESIDNGRHWHLIEPEGLPDPTALTDLASLSAGADKQWLIATYMGSEMSAGKLYVSRNGGRTWEEVFSSNGSPRAAMLTELGAEYSANTSYRMVLAFGKPADLTGVYLASSKELTWPDSCQTGSATCS